VCTGSDEASAALLPFLGAMVDFELNADAMSLESAAGGRTWAHLGCVRE
jgi:hypothetical protein